MLDRFVSWKFSATIEASSGKVSNAGCTSYPRCRTPSNEVKATGRFEEWPAAQDFTSTVTISRGVSDADAPRGAQHVGKIGADV